MGRTERSQRARTLRGGMSLALKLPLLMSAVLVIVVTIMLLVTYTTLRRNAIGAVEERLARGTRQLAAVSATSVFGNQARYRRVGNDSAVRRALRDPGQTGEAVKSALARASLPADSGMPVELWTADGRRVAFSGNDVRSVPLVAAGRPELPRRIAATFDTTSGITSPDSMRVSPLYMEGENIHLWFVQPIRQSGQTIGYITHQRKISTGANTQRILQDLSGDSVQLYYRNADGSLWSTMAGDQMPPLQLLSPSSARAPDGSAVVLSEERIGATPLVVGMQVPQSNLLVRPQATTRTIALLSLLLLLAGALASWVIGRSVARPLEDLTRAAGTMATGDYAVRVPEAGDVEVQRLAATFNHMAEEIGASREALEHQTEQAQAASSAKSDFLTTMSHELRTPLNAIGGYVELMEMGLRGPVTEAQRRDLERVKTSQQHLLGLISGVLDLARVEAGKVHYEMSHIAVDSFLAGIDALIAPQAAAKSVSLEYVPCPPDLVVIADREKLRQILLNLLSNAVRHTPAAGRIRLSAEVRTGRVGIVVEDTGPGIPANKREAVFEPFVQLDRSLTQTREGLGLGLAISRDLAHGMHGDLVVEDRGAPGSRFVLTLPIGLADSAAPVVRTDEIPASTGHAS